MMTKEELAKKRAEIKKLDKEGKIPYIYDIDNSATARERVCFESCKTIIVFINKHKIDIDQMAEEMKADRDFLNKVFCYNYHQLDLLVVLDFIDLIKAHYSQLGQIEPPKFV
jgi:hypothetical protein